VDSEQQPWLVVGLGNPGPEYELTPHNLGFLVVDRLSERHGIRVTRRECQALIGEGKIGGRPAILAKPQTFMNLSGQAVRGLLVKQDLAPDRLLVVYDDLDLPWQSIRIRPGGSAGTHNGMRSVVQCAGAGFPRLRLGIHPGRPVRDAAEFVLAPIQRALRNELDEAVEQGARAVESVLAEGVETAMAKFNRRAPGPNQEES
jgi:peptidyl-tRNA hydrolase, PTH1 family